MVVDSWSLIRLCGRWSVKCGRWFWLCGRWFVVADSWWLIRRSGLWFGVFSYIYIYMYIIWGYYLDDNSSICVFTNIYIYVLYYFILYFIILYYIILYYYIILLYYIILEYIILYYIMLYYVILYYIICIYLFNGIYVIWTIGDRWCFFGEWWGAQWGFKLNSNSRKIKGYTVIYIYIHNIYTIYTQYIHNIYIYIL